MFVSADKKRVSLEFLRFRQLESLVKLDNVVIILADKKRAGLDFLRFLQLGISMYFYNFEIFSAEKVHKPLTFSRKVKEFLQFQPVCHDFCQVPFFFVLFSAEW